MEYRREVDGLRSVAVLTAIFFHAGFSLFSGGFVGVDIFFVISGYLITSIILAEKKAGTFTLISFYERRARRILPALFVVMAACLPLAWLWSLPSDVMNFSDSLVAVTLSSSNLLFWATSGYFERASELKPLLHTWSLAVEEQYYVFFPLFLVLMWRLGTRWLLASLIVIAALSLAAAQWVTSFSPPTSYYLLPTRGWEILVGAFVAFYFFYQPQRNFTKTAREIGGALGCLLIVYAVVAFDRNTPFPSFYTLAPTLGTALIILFANAETLAGRLLGSRPFVGIGLISYSAYLWHQPLFAFTRQRLDGEPSKTLLMTLAAIALVLAYFSWKYVEVPFRNKHIFNRKQIFSYAVAGVAFFIAAGVAGHQAKIQTLWQMENPHLITFTEPKNKTAWRDCTDQIEKHGFTFCRVTGSGPKRVVLWGDSHGGVLAENIPSIDGVEFYSVWQYGCPPIAGVRRFDAMGDAIDCNELKILNDRAAFVKSLSPDVVILVGRWTLYLNGWQKQGVLQQEHKMLTDSDAPAAIKPLPERKGLFRQHLQQTIAMLSQHSKVILLTQVPDFGPTGFRRLESTEYLLPLNEMLAWHRDEIEIMDSLKGLPNLTVLDTKKFFCDDKVCRTRNDGALLYYDDDHLSPRGAELTWPLIIQALAKELPAASVAQQ